MAKKCSHIFVKKIRDRQKPRSTKKTQSLFCGILKNQRKRTKQFSVAITHSAILAWLGFFAKVACKALKLARHGKKNCDKKTQVDKKMQKKRHRIFAAFCKTDAKRTKQFSVAIAHSAILGVAWIFRKGCVQGVKTCSAWQKNRGENAAKKFRIKTH